MLRSAKTVASLQESEDAFLRDLPGLLSRHAGQWAAYHGIARIALVETKADAYAECRRQGFNDDEFLVRCVEPPLDESILGPDWQGA